MTVIHGNFEWDSEKNEVNKLKHGLSFEQILSVFDDPYFLEMYDTKHSTFEEDRMIGIGDLNGIVVVTTVFTERDKIRIISSRCASKNEEAFYYEQRNSDC